MFKSSSLWTYSFIQFLSHSVSLIENQTLSRESGDSHFLWVDDLLPEEGVFPGGAVEQAPVHLQVPDESVEGAHGGEDDQQVEEDVCVIMALFCREKTHKEIKRWEMMRRVHISQYKASKSAENECLC